MARKTARVSNHNALGGNNNCISKPLLYVEKVEILSTS